MSINDSKSHDAVQPEKRKPRLIGYLWDTFDKPPAERRLLTKLDAALLCFGAVGRFFKNKSVRFVALCRLHFGRQAISSRAWISTISTMPSSRECTFCENTHR
jgi:hypothetical protein